MLVSLIAFVIVIAICVLIHEYGHYITARILGVQVHEYAFGMGPALKQWVNQKSDGSKMTWSIRLLPIGGFCRIAGMGEDFDDEVVLPGQGFNEQPAWKRFFILLNGSLFNIILALLLMALYLSFQGVLDMESTRIGEVMPDFPAAKANIQVGDVIKEINNKEYTRWPEMSQALRDEGAKGEPVSIKILRDDKILEFKILIEFNQEYGRPMLGISPSHKRYGFINAFASSARYIYNMTIMMARGILDWLLRRQEVEVTGPVGIASMSGHAIRNGLWAFVTFISLISLNLGLMNLFPIPALDGGRILFVLLEMIFRRRLPDKVENWIHAAGFVILISLMIFITFHDVYNIFITH